MSGVSLVPVEGRMKAEIFENRRIRIPPTLFFEIDLPLEPFEFEGEIVRTSARLDSIRFGVPDHRALSDRTFRFPVNPEEGYIDGSIYLGHAHNPADVTEIQFGAVEERQVAASIAIRIDFTFEGPAELGVVNAVWKVTLGFDPHQLEKTIEDAIRRGARL